MVSLFTPVLNSFTFFTCTHVWHAYTVFLLSVTSCQYASLLVFPLDLCLSKISVEVFSIVGLTPLSSFYLARRFGVRSGWRALAVFGPAAFRVLNVFRTAQIATDEVFSQKR